jgi:LmbE family N-acetylglucosaminyl deacetylase
MMFSNPVAEIFVPDQEPDGEALARTTHLGVGAHQDDLEFMAAHGILECFGRGDRWFTGVTVTDGAGSPRSNQYAGLDDEGMKRTRRREQRKAAFVGEYAAQVQLAHPSWLVKDRTRAREVIADLVAILRATRPDVVYTHNLADKHDTHVAVALRLLEACRELPPEERPKSVLGCEVWRDLDWLSDEDKVAMAVDSHEHLQAALMGVFDSQIAGGKRYDRATLGRRSAHATYSESHGTDRHRALIWGMDLTPLLDASIDPASFVSAHIRRFETDVLARVAKFR